jgi:hypothetical protein
MDTALFLLYCWISSSPTIRSLSYCGLSEWNWNNNIWSSWWVFPSSNIFLFTSLVGKSNWNTKNTFFYFTSSTWSSLSTFE